MKPATLVQAKVYSVSEICRDIKLALESGFPEGVWIEGEISNLRIPSSGHVYFSLKDAQCVIQAVMFRGQAMSLRFTPTDGLKVLLFGAITIYEGRSIYQIIAQRMEPQGLGALQLAFEQLKAKLEAEGLFAPDRKRPIPMLPQRIAIVTSPTGAAIRDILHVLHRRFSNLEIGIYPVLVQGEGSAEAVATALRDLNELGGFEVIIVARGGGSLEDLWAFNQEIVARAVAASRIPVVSAVGHEVDTTICDMVADLRCATPSAAAEMIVGRKADIEDRLDALREDLAACLENAVLDRANRLQLALKSPGLSEPLRLVEGYAQNVDDCLQALGLALSHAKEIAEKNFERCISTLEALSPLAVLGRGYSLTFLEPHTTLPSKWGGKLVRESRDVREGDRLRTRLGKGEIHSTVSKVE